MTQRWVISRPHLWFYGNPGGSGNWMVDRESAILPAQAREQKSSHMGISRLLKAQPQVWTARASRKPCRFPDNSGFAGPAVVKWRRMMWMECRWKSESQRVSIQATIGARSDQAHAAGGGRGRLLLRMNCPPGWPLVDERARGPYGRDSMHDRGQGQRAA